MDDLFGIPMNLIMLILVALLGVSLAAVGYVVVRSRVMFVMGIRNMPRRIAQTTLIIIGLMLSTLIISAAFTTGDTVDRSLSAQIYRLLGHADEWVQRSGEGEQAPIGVESVISADLTQELRTDVETAADPNIDGFLPVLRGSVPVTNERSGQSEPSVNFAGLDVESLDGFPDVISSKTGEQLDVASLGPDEAFMNQSAADDLATEAGDQVKVFVQGQPHEFTIVDIVKDRLLTGAGDFGALEGMVTRLDTLQELFGQPGDVSFIVISNRGGVREGVKSTEEVVATLDRAFAGQRVEVYDVKKDLADGAEQAGNFMATFFLIFGLFSIAAGMLLIVMIFVMLAAERKPELGMARAVGTKRSHLIQMFMSEGMAYNVLSAMVGAALGVAVAFGIAAIMARIFGEYFDIQPHVTARSVIISYSLGVVLTFLTVTFASWRASSLNIVAAIRDLPETKPVNPEAGTLGGYLRGVLNAVVAVVLLPISAFVYMLRGHSFSFPADQRAHGERIPIWPLVIVPLAPFYLTALALIWLTRDRRPRSMPGWLVPAGIVVPPLGLVLVALQDRDRPISWLAGFATLGMVGGGLLVRLGLVNDQAFPFALGSSMILFGAAVILCFFGLRERPVYTGASVFLLVFWGFVAGGRMEFLFGKLQGDMEMFFLSGVAMVTASTFVLVYNADLVLTFVSRIGGAFSAILPAMKTAIAYPLANKFRTGMTLAMISLVIFALTMMSTMNTNFNRIFLTDSARGGWDVVVDENPNNPIADLSTAVAEGGSTIGQTFRAVGRVELAGESQVTEDTTGRGGFHNYPVFGVDTGFVEGGDIPLSARATGFDSDAAVWKALTTREDVAVVDRFAIEGGGMEFGGDALRISGIPTDAKVFDPVPLVVMDPVSERTEQVEVIGVIDFGASASFFGLYVTEQRFQSLFGEPILSRHYVGLKDPGHSKAAARAIEAALLPIGAQAESIKQQIDDGQQAMNNFFLLMQGFMGLGLFVGIAAVGVIAFRTVVERRQQIGMLRAIGYKRSTVALSFLLESSFITLLGIASGVGLAIWLSIFLITSDEFPASTGFAIPWLQILFISGLAFLASLVMTFIPSRQAAGVPIADALRYE